MKIPKKIPIAFLFAFLIAGMTSQKVLALPIIPEAEGVSAETVGGRGGAVIKVTNLDDSGTGSFRACAEASNPRVCIFETSGWISLITPIVIDDPYITIAGQSSPGGVGLRATMGFSDGNSPKLFYINTHDVLITHMRFAMGAMLSGGTGGDSFSIYGNNEAVRDSDSVSPDNDSVYNIYIDHCSIRWGCDECGETAYNPNRVTIAWSVIGPGLYNCHPGDEGNHDLGWLFWGPYTSAQAEFSMHHTFFAHNHYRMPYTSESLVDIWNDVTFDGYGGYTGLNLALEGGRVNYRHNYCKKIAGYGNPGSSGREVAGWYKGNPYPALYVDENIGCYRTAGQDDWLSVSDDWYDTTLGSGWRSYSPFPINYGLPPVITPMTAEYAAEVVINSGATKPIIDSHDQTYKNNFLNNIHARYDGDAAANEASDWPALTGGPTPTDSDSDGMSDAWESSIWGNTAQYASGDQDSDGYTNIEEYLHYLGGYTSSQSDLTPPGAPLGLVVR